MEQIRRDALNRFNQNIHFTGISQNSHILSQGPEPRWSSFPEAEIFTQAKNRLTAGGSLLVCLPHVSADIRFDFKRELFIALVDLFKIDHAAFRPLSSIESTFCWYPGKQNDTYYARVSMTSVLWTFDRASSTTRALLISCGTQAYIAYTPAERASISAVKFFPEYDAELLSQPLGLVWHSCILGVKWAKTKNDECWAVLDTVERGTGYGKDLNIPGQDNPDLYTEWLRKVSRVASTLSTSRKHCGSLSAMYRCLTQSDSSGGPLFEDQEALLIAKGYLDHEISKLEDLSERTRNQTSVVSNPHFLELE
jgi:hypothetical protein